MLRCSRKLLLRGGGSLILYLWVTYLPSRQSCQGVCKAPALRNEDGVDLEEDGTDKKAQRKKADGMPLA